jgi:hypothetical protein
MKRLIIISMILCVYSMSAYAQTGMMESQQGQMGQGMMMGEGKQQPMMNCPMMQQMSGQGAMQSGQQMCPMMGQNMMQMMMDMMNMQEKMMKGVKAEEKKMMMKDMTQMKGKMQNMMSMCGMTGGMMGKSTSDSSCRMNCAEQWLKKAIDLHDVQIKDPKTATEASQMEMMEQMKKAYDCITGAGSGMCGSQSKESMSKEPEKKKTSKGDPHGH